MAMFEIHAVDEQIKTLPTYKTASGSVATFETDMTENLISCVCDFSASGGGGTPSPSNPRPIGVYDSITLYHNSINLWNEQWQKGVISSGVFNPSGDRVCSKNFIRVKPSTRLYIASSIAWVFFYQNANENSYISNAQTPITTPANCNYIKFYTTSSYGQTYQNDLFVSYEDISYIPFNGAYIPFGQTVSNGVIDVTTGKLTITHGYISSYNGESINEPWVSSIDEYVENTNPSTGAEVVYPLTTPTIIQLDSKTITALLNENNIWCDTGDITAKYILSVGEALRQA